MNFQFTILWSLAFAVFFTQTALGAAPSPRYGHTAVWTGNEMIVWGGTAADGTSLGDGARYDPGSKTWTSISMLNAPVARFDHTVVWTGSEMIIWGGRSGPFNYLGNGARYDPAIDQWIPLNNAGAPTARGNHRAVWTGSEMIVWGGLRGDITYGNDGARYNPANNSWIAMTTNGAPAGRISSSAVWTGNRMVIWGGNGSIVQGLFNDGGRYDPVANNWTPVSTNNAPTNRHSHVTVWTGNEMVIWGGYNGTTYEASGGRYHAASDSWSVLPTLAAPTARGFASAVWTGSDMIVWGGADGTNRNTGARYNLLANQWTATTTNSAPAARSQHTAIWSGSEMVVWAGRNNAATYDDVGRYNPVIDSWTTFGPGVATLSATSNSLTSATLNGIAYPNNTNTSVWFEWGSSTNYGSRTVTQSVGSGTNGINFSQLFNGLGGGIMHFRGVASNSLGIAYGSNVSFSLPLFLKAGGDLDGLHRGSVAWGDYDNDGFLEILATGLTTNAPTTKLYRLNGGNFTEVFFIPLPGISGDTRNGAAVWGDYDNDGFLDIALSGTINSSFFSAIGQLWRNNGSGSFENVNNGSPGFPGLVSCSLAWGDYDHDGRLDLLMSGYDWNVEIWRNVPTGFVNAQTGMDKVSDGTARWGDYDNDGRLDVLAAGLFDVNDSSSRSQLWRDTGSGLINSGVNLPPVTEASAAWADYDNDGRLDFLLTGSDSTNRISLSQLWRNTGTGFTNVPIPGLPGVYFGSVAWGDYDNDGRPDFVITGATGTNANNIPIGYIAQVWRNTGSGFVNSGAFLPGVFNSSVAWGDYDNDGRLDILFNGATNLVNGEPSGLITAVWRNNTAASNTAPTPPNILTATALNGVVTLNWSAGGDVQTPSSGLTYNMRVGTTPGGSDIVGPMAASNGRRRLPEMGNRQQARTWTIATLPVNVPIYWSVQSVDSAFAGSPFAAERTFRLVQAPPILTSITNVTLPPGDLNGNGVVDQNELNMVLANYFPNSPFLRMTNVAGLGGTNVTFTLSNSTAGAFSVEYTTNLVDWLFLGPATPRYLFTDTNAPANPQRYYRLRWP